MSWRDYPPPGLLDGRTTDLPDRDFYDYGSVNAVRPMIDVFPDHAGNGGGACGFCIEAERARRRESDYGRYVEDVAEAYA